MAAGLQGAGMGSPSCGGPLRLWDVASLCAEINGLCAEINGGCITLRRDQRAKVSGDGPRRPGIKNQHQFWKTGGTPASNITSVKLGTTT